jgi:hypothetical protein
VEDRASGSSSAASESDLEHVLLILRTQAHDMQGSPRVHADEEPRGELLLGSLNAQFESRCWTGFGPENRQERIGTIRARQLAIKQPTSSY